MALPVLQRVLQCKMKPFQASSAFAICKQQFNSCHVLYPRHYAQVSSFSSTSLHIRKLALQFSEVDLLATRCGLWLGQNRHYAKRKGFQKQNTPSKGKRATSADDSGDETYEDDDEDDDDDDGDDDWIMAEEIGIEEDEFGSITSKSYKDVQFAVPSMRLDGLLGSGLNTSRRKIEDAFLSSKIRINGKVVEKKSKMVNVGDTIDMMLPYQDSSDSHHVMRIFVQGVKSSTTSRGKTPVKIRRWKSLVISRDEYK